ncbi:hypothetical protein PR048_024598 [Dryococelus australis]|uniref:Uncharacterized protein n=1 Tax=Dryococelus australis TaxID=614101 RepID=A0ABQ9GP37_9NEOP|nr:hypothetical protein PR048_024598 [Dryococelus australis]
MNGAELFRERADSALAPVTAACKCGVGQESDNNQSVYGSEIQDQLLVLTFPDYDRDPNMTTYAGPRMVIVGRIKGVASRWSKNPSFEMRYCDGAVAVASLLVSHFGEPGSIPCGIVPGFSHVGIVPGDAAGLRVFSGISRSPSPLNSGAAPYSHHSTLIGSRNFDIKSRTNLVNCPLVSFYFKLGLHEAEEYPGKAFIHAQCRWSTGFLGDIPFPRPLHSGAAPYSPRFTLIGSQDPDVKTVPWFKRHKDFM